MRKAILLAAAMVASASVAQAQGRDRDRDDDDDYRREYREERGRDRDDYHRWHRRGGFGGGARFFIRSGETRLGVVCDRGESMRTCVDAALTLFDRIRQGAPSGTSGTTGGSPPASRP
jgi:hypothetical protein